jgi:hypothetical protein
MDVLGSQQVGELIHQINQSEQYFNEYRSHLSPLKSEAQYPYHSQVTKDIVSHMSSFHLLFTP